MFIIGIEKPAYNSFKVPIYNLYFQTPIYTDATTMFEMATKSDECFDVVSAVVSQIHQVDLYWDTINEQIKELFGEEACKYLNDVDLKKYIYYTGKHKYKGVSAGDSDLLVYWVDCVFDVNKFALRYNLEPIPIDFDALEKDI